MSKLACSCAFEPDSSTIGVADSALSTGLTVTCASSLS